MFSIFSYIYQPSVCFLWRNVCLGVLPIFWLDSLFFLILSSMSCLHIFVITPLSVVSFAIILLGKISLYQVISLLHLCFLFAKFITLGRMYIQFCFQMGTIIPYSQNSNDLRVKWDRFQSPYPLHKVFQIQTCNLPSKFFQITLILNFHLNSQHLSLQSNQ